MITNFLQKAKSENKWKNKCFNMNYLNENIIAQNVANNVITSPFGMGEGFLNKVIITLIYG